MFLRRAQKMLMMLIFFDYLFSIIFHLFFSSIFDFFFFIFADA